MTRYSFVLLISRVIGILSLISILEILQSSVALNSSTRFLSVPKEQSLPVLPLVAVSVGAAILLAGCIWGLSALRLAKHAQAQVELNNKLVPLAFAAIVFWALIERMCFRLIGLGLLTWRTHGEAADNRFLTMIARQMDVPFEAITPTLWTALAMIGGFASFVAYTLWQRTEEIPT